MLIQVIDREPRDLCYVCRNAMDHSVRGNQYIDPDDGERLVTAHLTCAERAGLYSVDQYAEAGE